MTRNALIVSMLMCVISSIGTIVVMHAFVYAPMAERMQQQRVALSVAQEALDECK